MKNLIICILLCLFLQGCIISISEYKYSSGNYAHIKADRDSISAKIMAEDKSKFNAIMESVLKVFKEWRE